MRSANRLWRAFPMMLLAACGGPGAVEYVDGKCMIGGVSSTLAQVETHQAVLTHHILARQPVLTAIAVAAVAIAGGSYIQRMITVLAARRASAQTFSDRVRARMERYREHPLRYFSILGGALAILIAAGAAYISLDSDKRQSERALATLQFCHLALRTADEQRVLAQQRDNLASIQSTAGDIRALVDKLPPAEQEKAHEIVDQFNSALGQQRTLVTRYAVEADASAKAVEEKQADVARGISKLDGAVGNLQTVPVAIDKLGGALRGLDARDDDLAGALGKYDERLDAISKAVDDLAARPPVTCPVVACSCGVASPPPTLLGSAPPAQPQAQPQPKSQPKPTPTPATTTTASAPTPMSTPAIATPASASAPSATAPTASAPVDAHQGA